MVVTGMASQIESARRQDAGVSLDGTAPSGLTWGSAGRPSCVLWWLASS